MFLLKPPVGYLPWPLLGKSKASLFLFLHIREASGIAGKCCSLLGAVHSTFSRFHIDCIHVDVCSKKCMCFILSFRYLHGKRLHECIDANTELGPHSNHANPSVGYLAQNCDGMQTSANRSWRYTLSIKLLGFCTDMCHTLMFCDAPESLNGQQCSLSLSSCSLWCL